jgi:hypothetical protein
MNVQCEPTYHVVSHLVLEKESGILYIVDTGNERILTLNTHTGSFQNNLTPYESVAEYSNFSSATWSVFADSGLVTPSGIDLFNDRLLVSDYATGDIIVYDLATADELGRIVTGTPGIMGIKVGPDGKIWYVNATTNEVIRLDMINTGIVSTESVSISVFPNPATSFLRVNMNGIDKAAGTISDLSGRIVSDIQLTQGMNMIDLKNFAAGIYSLRIVTEGKTFSERIIVSR